MTGGPAGTRVRTVFLGSGGFAVPALGRIATHSQVEVVAVVTAPPRPAGRRRVLTATPVGALAGELGIPVLAPPRLREPSAVASILELRPGLAVLADYGQLVPGPILELTHGALNLHPSALPRWRGAAPIPATILAGDVTTAVTLMRMDAGLDTGPIVAVEPVVLRGDESAPVLEACLAHAAAELLGRCLGPWLLGELAAVPQPSEGVTLTRPLRRDDGRLDPARPAVELERQVRAYDPWPGTFLEVAGRRVGVIRAAVAASAPGDAPGRLVPHGEGVALATAAGRLVLEVVRPAGGRAMPGAAYRRGHRRDLEPGG